MRVTSYLTKDDKGKLRLPAAHSHFEEVQQRMLCLLDEHGEITGYQEFEPVDKWFMLAYWTRFDGLDKVMDKDTYDRFCKWFSKVALYPDYIRRSREMLVSKGLVEVPSHVKRRMQGKAKAFQGSMAIK